MSLAVVNLVTPKAGAKHELLFNKSASIKALPSVVVSSGMYYKIFTPK